MSSTSPATCLPPGQYRVQLYINGHLAGTATATSDWPALHAVRFSEVDGAVCVPQGCKPFPSLGAGADGYAAPNSSAGAFILSIPKAAVAAIANDQPSLAGVMQATVNGFSRARSLLPGLQQVGKTQSTPFFMSSDNGQQQDWAYKQRLRATQAWGRRPTARSTSGSPGATARAAWPIDLFLSLSPLSGQRRHHD